MSIDRIPTLDQSGLIDGQIDGRTQLPSVNVVTPRALEAPIVFSSPHSGTYYPKEMCDALRVPLLDLRRTEDAFVDRLFQDVPMLGGTLISAVYARGYVDLNRAKDELDGTMFEGGLDQPAGERSPRVEAGLGCIPRIGASGNNIYASKLNRDEANSRLARAYDPYHDALKSRITSLREKFGEVFVVDCHSMPSHCHGRRMTADFVLGDRFGSACSGLFTITVERFLRRLGYKVARNTPYAGGFITERHGRPHRKAHALQIEINRALYMDERTVTQTSNFEALQSDLRKLATHLVEWSGDSVCTKKKPRQLGAAKVIGRKRPKLGGNTKLQNQRTLQCKKINSRNCHFLPQRPVLSVKRPENKRDCFKIDEFNSLCVAANTVRHGVCSVPPEWSSNGTAECDGA